LTTQQGRFSRSAANSSLLDNSEAPVMIWD
jgi:hypothetical protein